MTCSSCSMKCLFYVMCVCEFERRCNFFFLFTTSIISKRAHSHDNWCEIKYFLINSRTSSDVGTRIELSKIRSVQQQRRIFCWSMEDKQLKYSLSTFHSAACLCVSFPQCENLWKSFCDKVLLFVDEFIWSGSEQRGRAQESCTTLVVAAHVR